ncbi:hypothetical protein [Paraglaciecola chathamensis]|jgi:hypothetical protein|uniref:hypothetical protein n=1 Tax=Paraglaciecola chathamensis TaxID=368405 RepID=UPI0002F92D9E|nr:hypothetical protein [Paraglaciecola chathamensis]MDO6561640.1 hypothetical protein [Paraglaciecola chathamensis]|tara:strand:+ start:56788 stop:57126 length:339 start_codon:yes stop_codon:yes gene_type:complete
MQFSITLARYGYLNYREIFMLKLLTATRHDRSNCRLYVHDHEQKPFVIIDQGHLVERAGGQRYELYSVTAELEPNCPIDKSVSWELINGITGSQFDTGLKYTFNPVTYSQEA